MPTHADASQDPDAHYTYEFNGWTPEITEVTANADYTATYTYIVNKYTVTWKDENGTVLETNTEAPYGEMPTYNGATPTKESTDDVAYVFAGWTPAVSEVTVDVEYVAIYEVKEIEQNIQGSSSNDTE